MNEDNWLYKEEAFNEAPSDKYGFVYIITNLVNDRKYIGRKILWNTVTKPPLKGKKRKRKIKKESDWKKYYGSSSFVKEDIDEFGKENFKREILVLCDNKTEMTFFETYFQWKLDVLYSRLPNGEKEFYNGSILGKFFWKDHIEDKLELLNR